MSNPARTDTEPPIASLPADDEDERSLIARVANGDQRAARVLYNAHAARVLRLAYRFCRDDDLAADLTQETFVLAFRRASQFRGDSAFSTWLHRIAVSVSLNGMRKVKRLNARETDLDEARHHESPGGGADLDLRARLAAAIDALPDGLRMALVMHAIEGYTHVEIGEALGIAEGTSKTKVFQARARLREALADYAEEA